MKRTAIFSPDWFNKSAIYQINPRTFSKDGTIQAITHEIPFLKDLGFRILYLCPIFEADESLDNRSPDGSPRYPAGRCRWHRRSR